MILGPSRKGRKIVISGDTKPCEEMIAFSKDADVLVHEATFDSELEDIAKEYGHTTAFTSSRDSKKSKGGKTVFSAYQPTVS